MQNYSFQIIIDKEIEWISSVSKDCENIHVVYSNIKACWIFFIE